MRTETVDIQRMAPGRALVRLVEKSVLSRREFDVVRLGYDPTDDWEIGVVEMLGDGDWDPVEVGDHVIVRAGSGGKAGADVSKLMGEHYGSVIVVSEFEIVVKISEFGGEDG